VFEARYEEGVDFVQCRDGGELEEGARLDEVSEGLMVGQLGVTYFGRGREYIVRKRERNES
jgi:hypothetical protein